MNAPDPIIRKGRKFDQVLDGAREVFLRDGFEGASVDEVARAAAVSKATLYSYFPDKRVMFAEMAQRECAFQADRISSSIDFTASPHVVLETVARGFLGILLSDFGRRVFRMCVAESERFPELARRFYESGPAVMRARMISYLSDAVARGELKIDDIELAADQFPELCKAGVHMRTIFGLQTEFSEKEIDRTVQGAVDMFLARYAA